MKALQVPTHTPVVFFLAYMFSAIFFHIYSLRFQVLFAKCCGKKNNNNNKETVSKRSRVACVQTFPASSKTGVSSARVADYCWFAFVFWSGYCSVSFQSFVLITSFGALTRLQHQKTE